MSFKALKTLDNLYKLYEAADDDTPVDATMAVGGLDDNNESNQFISAEKKIELAKTVLNAFYSEPPEEGTIPKDLLNVTTTNADNVINFVTACINLEAPLTLTNQNQPDSLPNVLQHV